MSMQSKLLGIPYIDGKRLGSAGPKGRRRKGENAVDPGSGVYSALTDQLTRKQHKWERRIYAKGLPLRRRIGHIDFNDLVIRSCFSVAPRRAGDRAKYLGVCVYVYASYTKGYIPLKVVLKLFERDWVS